MRENLKALGMGILLFTLIALAGFLNYKIWRLQHPDAPTWTYFLSDK